ncbi:ABC transporter permease [Spiroplasma turonicum]|nr:hypothetical protein [Spiroplasma turonicum]ALX70406.1 ABC transporter permease [Spiroplasma turonicum]
MKKSITNVNCFKIIYFLFKNLLFDKTFIYFNIVTIAFSVLFSIYTSFLKDNSQVAIYFDFYALFFIGVVMFMLIIRINFYFFVRKTEDRTIFVTLSNVVSRLNLLFSIYLCGLIIILSQVLFSFIFFNLMFSIFHFDNSLILQKTFTFLWFAPLLLFCLSNFVIFLLIFFNNQVTMTFLTLLLTFTFVANLPLKFIKSSEETTILSFNNIKNGKNQLYNVNDIYEALDLQNYINNNMIKFKYLSKFINNFLISPNNSIDKSELSNDKNKLLRSNLWTELGLIVEDNQVAKINDVTFRKLNYSNNEIPQNWVKDFMSNKNRHYDLTLSFNKRFININELNKLILNEKDDDKKLILNDLYKFQEFINGYYTNLQSSFYSLFDDFIFFNDKQSKIDAKPGECSEQSNDCSADLKVEVLKANYVAMFANISNNNDILFNDSISNDLERFVKQTLNYPLMIAIRLLENYFVSYTTTYKKIINSQLDLNNEDYKKYNSTRNIFTYFTIFSPFYGLWSNYTYYSGYSFDDLWFNPYSDSKIDLYSQQNIFMPYVQYNFIIDNDGKILPNTYDYFISPSSYIIFYLIITYIAIACSYWKFKRISF